MFFPRRFCFRFVRTVCRFLKTKVANVVVMSSERFHVVAVVVICLVLFRFHGFLDVTVARNTERWVYT